MITRIDVGDALTVLTANDSSKTPRPDELTMRAWCDNFARWPQWSGDDLVAAAHEYCQKPRERMVQPADLGVIIRSYHRDRLDRMEPAERGSAWADLGGHRRGPAGERLDRFGEIDKSAPDPVPYPPDWTGVQRVVNYWQRVRNRTVADTQPGERRAPDEHLPGPPCVTEGCGKASTFGEHCARHYCLTLMGSVGLTNRGGAE